MPLKWMATHERNSQQVLPPADIAISAQVEGWYIGRVDRSSILKWMEDKLASAPGGDWRGR